MTAEIAILNTHGVAIAADSAITLHFGENEQKIYNSANKLFTLSKYHPVGIMIYSSANFMGIEWEIIIKEYRKAVGKKAFKTLFEYASDFTNFVGRFKYIKIEQEKNILISFCFMFFSYMRDKFLNNLEQNSNNDKINSKQINKTLNDTILWLSKIHNNTPDESLFKIDSEYINSCKNEVIQTLHEVFEDYELSNIQKEKMIKLLIKDLQKRIGQTSFFSGIVITGFGNDEIFPSIYSCHIHAKLGKSLLITNEQKIQISLENSAQVIPFAQSEMVSSFMEGIDPLFEKEIEDQLSSLINKLETIVDKSYKEKLIVIRNDFFKYLEKFKRTIYINPIMDIVNSLQKTELAKMAESLVNLTTFKRHISKDSETVQEPIDVAVITKGDGFVWIKRKHYFDIKLNSHFVNNYFLEVDNE